MKIKVNSMFRNMGASLICRVIALISGLVVQRYILISFGSTYNGLTSLISQIMSYLVLLEAGLGSASIQAFYAPLNDGDWKRTSGIMNATSSSYLKIGLIFGGLLVGGTFLVPLAALGEVDYFVAGLLTFITGAGTVSTYIFASKNIALLNADKKMYVVYTMDAVSTFASMVLRVIALNFGCDIVSVQLINLMCMVLKNISFVIYVKKKYPFLDKRVPPDFKAISKRWSVLIHNIAGLVVNHTDVLILTVATSLKLVSVYNVYNMIYGQMANVIQMTFSQAPQGEFGRLFHKDKAEFEKLFARYEVLYSILLFVIMTITLIMTKPFIALYTAGVSDINYIDKWLPILFAAILLMNLIRCPAILTVNSAGAFKETQRGAIIEAVINLTVSIALFAFTDLGMYGLLLGTVCSYFYRTVDVIYYVYKHVLTRSVFKFLRIFAVNLGCSVILWYSFCVQFAPKVDSYLDWVVTAIVISVITALSFGIANFLLNFKETRDAIKGVVKKTRKASEIDSSSKN